MVARGWAEYVLGMARLFGLFAHTHFSDYVPSALAALMIVVCHIIIARSS